MEKGGNYYEFFYNSRMVKPTILHFQVEYHFLLLFVAYVEKELMHFVW